MRSLMTGFFHLDFKLHPHRNMDQYFTLFYGHIISCCINIQHLVYLFNSWWTLASFSLCACLLSHVRLFDPMDCSPPGSSVHGILQARVLEWVATSSSRRSSQPRHWTQVSRMAGAFFTSWATREAVVNNDAVNMCVPVFCGRVSLRYTHWLNCWVLWQLF